VLVNDISFVTIYFWCACPPVDADADMHLFTQQPNGWAAGQGRARARRLGVATKGRASTEMQRARGSKVARPLSGGLCRSGAW
jgi:hypothetical protein